MADREVWIWFAPDGEPHVIDNEALALGAHPPYPVRYIPAESVKAEAQPAGTGWVSVEERLPEPNVVVLAWDGHSMALSEYDASIWADCQPTYWRHLPPAPEPRQ